MQMQQRAFIGHLGLLSQTVCNVVLSNVCKTTFSQVLLVWISLCYLGSTHHIHTKPLVKTVKSLQQILRENWRPDLIVMQRENVDLNLWMSRPSPQPSCFLSNHAIGMTVEIECTKEMPMLVLIQINSATEGRLVMVAWTAEQAGAQVPTQAVFVAACIELHVLWQFYSQHLGYLGYLQTNHCHTSFR